MNEVVRLRCDEVIVPTARVRALKPEDAAAIGQSIRRHGQFDPIKVVRDPRSGAAVLVDGWHRLEGCRLAGIDTVDVIFIRADRAQRTRHEVISGIARATHDVFDRAAAIDALARLARAEAGLPEEGDLRKLNGRAPTPSACEASGKEILRNSAESIGWDEKVAERLGCGVTGVRELTTIHYRIAEAHKEFLRARGQAGRVSHLLRFARLTEEQMAAVIADLEAATSADLAWALDRLAGPEDRMDPRKKAVSAFLRKAAGWSERERADFWKTWAAAYHRDGRPRRPAAG